MNNKINIVRFEGAYKHYNNNSENSFALFNVSASFTEGSFNVILGESGSGKTTFLKLLSGLIQLSKGDIFFKNHNLNSLNYSQLAEMRRESFGFVFQEIGLLDHLKCFENIQFPELKFDIEEVKGLSDYFGISHCLNKFPNEISLGEKQRVALARALYKKPDVLVADEPTANLDWNNAKKSIELIKKITSNGKTVFVATHDERILEYATKMIRLKSGKIIEME